MRITYSCPLVFDSPGPGLPQGAIFRGLDKHSKEKGGEDEVYIIKGEDFPYDHKSLYHGMLMDDFIAHSNLPILQEARKADAFIGVACCTADMTTEIHANGGKVATTWWSSHWKYADKILSETYKKFGNNDPPIDPVHINRAIWELEHSDVLIVPSEWCASTYRELVPKPAEQVKVVPFGVDSEKFHPPAPGEAAIDLTFSVLFAGGNAMRKGLSDLVAAWNNLQYRDGMLTVLGARLENASRYWRMKCLGWIPDEKVPEVFRNNKVFVLPSLEEGSALVVYNAMASGLPIIVTKEAGAPIEDGKEGLIVPKQDPKKIEEAIRYFHDNPSEIERMGRAGREKALTLTWERFGEGIYQVLAEMGKK